MKTILSGALLILLCFTACLPAGHAQTCNCSTFVSGDTIRVQASESKCLNGNTTAVVIVSGGTLCIPPGDTLTMKRAFLTGGKIINNSVIHYDTTGYFVDMDTARISNNGTIIITKNSLFYLASLYVKPGSTVIANGSNMGLTGTFRNAGTFIANADTLQMTTPLGNTLQNWGTVIVNGAFVMYSNMPPNFGSAHSTFDNYAGASFIINGNMWTKYNYTNQTFITNRGLLRINGNVYWERGTAVANFGELYTVGYHVNVLGRITNNGLFSANPSIGFSATNSFMTNNCKFLVADSFYSAQRVYNNGLLQVTNTNGILSLGTGGSFESTVKGKTMGARFTNNGTVKGGGDFYFTGETRQAGTFAGSYNNTDSFLNFYDVSNTSPAIPGSFFDFGIQGAKVKRVAFTAPDTATYACNLADTVYVPLLPLPIQLYSFTAEAAGNQVALRWLTGEEKNVRTFEIERSTTGTGWKMIGATAAANAPGQHSYAFTDILPNSGLNLYRIKVVDIDGKYTYSDTRAVSLGVIGNDRIAVYPNPATDQLNLVYYNAQQDARLSYQVINMAGSVVLRGEWKISTGANTRTINVTGLGKGLYLLKLQDNSNGTVILQQKITRQ